MKKILILSLLCLFAMALHAQSITGTWKTIDDETGKAKSVVEMSIKGGKLYGKIVKLYREAGEEQDPDCDECPGELKGQKIIGMQIVNGLEKDGKEWYAKRGILDPNNGKVYNCKMWVEGDQLMVRGYIGPFYRTQTWHKITL